MVTSNESFGQQTAEDHLYSKTINVKPEQKYNITVSINMLITNILLQHFTLQSIVIGDVVKNLRIKRVLAKSGL
jgi:hypothetical protein